MERREGGSKDKLEVIGMDEVISEKQFNKFLKKTTKICTEIQFLFSIMLLLEKSFQ